MKSGETINLDVLNERVELLLGILVVIAASAHSNADLAGDVSDSAAPDESVEAGVNTDVLTLSGGLNLHWCTFPWLRTS